MQCPFLNCVNIDLDCQLTGVFSQDLVAPVAVDAFFICFPVQGVQSVDVTRDVVLDVISMALANKFPSLQTKQIRGRNIGAQKCNF